MSLESFRDGVRGYWQSVDKSQADLADALAMGVTTLSRKLNGTDKAKFSSSEVKAIVKTLAEWGAISRRSEAVKLLELAGFTEFSMREWEHFPLSELAIDNEQAGLEVLSSKARPEESVAHNLPAHVTSLVGRDYEIELIKNILLGGNIRLLTLTGAGGIGKTRLALQVAFVLLEYFEDGVFFLDLVAAHNKEMLISALAKTLDTDRVSDNNTELENLKKYLRNKQMLLVLDNFEQLSDSSPLLAELLVQAPYLKLLVTSRTLLHLYGEHEYVVPSLALPNLNQALLLEDASNYASIALFVERAQAANPEFVLNKNNVGVIGEICSHLDGLPLAIELAASRVKFFSPHAILTKWNEQKFKFLTTGSRNLPLRHQSLQHAIDWSYTLLIPQAQKVFDYVAIFTAGFTFEAAQKVVGETVTFPEDLFDVLTTLADNSLLIKTAGINGDYRFKMLETIREYALEHLSIHNIATILEANYSDYYLHLTEEAEPYLVGTDQEKWMNYLDQELDNIRSVLAWAIDRGEINAALRISSALGRFWVTKAYFNEGRRWLNTSLEKAYSNDETPQGDRLVAKALQMLALIALRQADYDQARLFYNKALSLFERAGYILGIADTLKGLGVTDHSQANFDEAMQVYNKSLALYKGLNNKQGTADLLSNIAVLMDTKGDFEAATPLYEESLALRRQVGSKQSLADSLNNLGERLRTQGEYKKAKELLEESLLLYRESGYKQGLALPLINLAHLFSDQGDLDTSKSLYLEAIDLLKEQGSKSYLTNALNGLGILFYTQQNYEGALKVYEEGLALAREIDAEAELVDILHGMAIVALDTNDTDKAKSLLKESLTIGRAIGLHSTNVANLEGLAEIAVIEKQYNRAVYLFAVAFVTRENDNRPLNTYSLESENKIKAQLLSNIGTETYESWWKKGCSFSLEQAVDYALEELELE